MTIYDVAKHLGLNWDLVKSIQKRHLEKKYGNPDLRQLKRIAIYEIYVGKRGYLTIVLDVLCGAVVFVGDGNSLTSQRNYCPNRPSKGFAGSC